MAMAAKFALFHIKFVTVSLDRRHRNKSMVTHDSHKVDDTGSTPVCASVRIIVVAANRLQQQ